jgi:hypothetical protein
MLSADLSNVGLRSILKVFCCLIPVLQKASLQEQFWHYCGYHRIIFLSEEFMKAVRGKNGSACQKCHDHYRVSVLPFITPFL